MRQKHGGGVILRLPGGAGERELPGLFPAPAFRIYFMDGAEARGKDGLMPALAGALGLPSGFGRNWDALLDCLRDLPDPGPGGGYVLAVRNSALLLSAEPGGMEAFTEVFSEAAGFLREARKIELKVVLL